MFKGQASEESLKDRRWPRVNDEGTQPGMTRLVAQARGRVQGVSFRDFVAFHARRLGVTGSVRNLPSGTAVEVVAEGERPLLERLLEQVRRGPPGARVQQVEAEWQPARGEFASFRIRY